MAFKPAPLNTAFFATSIIGFLISVFYIYPKTIPWGIAFGLIFALMFIAAIISMNKAAPSAQLPKKRFVRQRKTAKFRKKKK